MDISPPISACHPAPPTHRLSVRTTGSHPRTPGARRRRERRSRKSGTRIRGGVDGDCLNIVSTTDAEKSSQGSFAGMIMSGCPAGAFRAAFPGSTGLQFVYDSANDEIVVFASG